MNGHVYKARPSPYALAHSVLLQAQDRFGTDSLTTTQAEREMKVTPGLMFAPGVTFEDVFQVLERWQLLEVKQDKTIAVRSWTFVQAKAARTSKRKSRGTRGGSKG